jgi:hypothetical protein
MLIKIWQRHVVDLSKLQGLSAAASPGPQLLLKIATVTKNTCRLEEGRVQHLRAGRILEQCSRWSRMGLLAPWWNGAKPLGRFLKGDTGVHAIWLRDRSNQWRVIHDLDSADEDCRFPRCWEEGALMDFEGVKTTMRI